MRHDDERLSAGEALLWAALGSGAGLLAGITLSLGGWRGPARVRRAANRIREAAPPQLTIGASVQAVRVALQAEPRLSGLWHPGRAGEPRRGGAPGLGPQPPGPDGGRPTALAVPGIESVINSILVRGEDDQALSEGPRANDQTA